MKSLPKMLLLYLLVMVAMTGCADYTPVEIPEGVDIANFWDGILHGWLLPFAVWAKIFGTDVDVYATYNNGAGYAWGYIIGVAAIYSGFNTAKDQVKKK